MSTQQWCGHGMSAARVGVDMGCPRPGWAWTWDVHGVHTHSCRGHTTPTPAVGVEIPCPHPCCADIPCPRPTHKIMLWTSHVHTSAWTSHVHALRLGVDMGCPYGQGVDMKCPRHLSMGWVWTWDVHTARIAGGHLPFSLLPPYIPIPSLLLCSSPLLLATPPYPERR